MVFCMSLRTSASLEYGLRWDFIPHDAMANVGESATEEVPKQVKPGRQRRATSRGITKYK
jgi:hypothetical protein